MALTKINGRSHFFETSKLVITPVSAGRWSVEYDRATFTVIGGRKSGGASHEWFVHNQEFFGDRYVPCKSMVEAIRLGIAY